MKKIILILLTMVSLYGWETTTHRAIDRKALGNVPNLNSFVSDSGIDSENYGNEIFDDYGMTYFKYIKEGELNGMSELNAKFPDTKYQSLIEAGTMLEDAQWIHDNVAPPYIPDGLYDTYDRGHGRFMNHFYNYQGFCKSLKCLTTDAISWAYDSGGNDYDYMDAMSYFAKGFSEPDANERRKYQAKMFVSVGHMMHMLNDMNVPAHVRDDGHPNYEPLEIWMKGGSDHSQNTGFYIKGNTPSGSLKGLSAGTITPQSEFSEYMNAEARHTSLLFFSENTIYTPLWFSPRESETQRSERINIGNNTVVSYIESKLLSDHKKIGMVVESWIIGGLGPVLNDVNKTMTLGRTAVFDGDYSVLEDNGHHLIPRAIANAAGFVNYFFRGQMKATMTPCSLTIKNVSKVDYVASSETVVFKEKGVFGVYVELPNKMVHLVVKLPLDKNLDVNQSVSFGGVKQKLQTLLKEQNLPLDDSYPLTVIYDGDIGTERGVSVKKFESTMQEEEPTPEPTRVASSTAPAVNSLLEWMQQNKAYGIKITTSRKLVQEGERIQDLP